MAWIIKLKSNWIKRKRGALKRESFSFLTAIELASSRILLLQVMQQESFPAEFKALPSGISVHNSLKIASLYPIFHNGLNSEAEFVMPIFQKNLNIKSSSQNTTMELN